MTIAAWKVSVALVVTARLASAMMDWGFLPGLADAGKLPTFADPGIRPPSFIFAEGQYWPPYDLNANTMDPASGCNAIYASLCAVQHAIRMVTRARVEACPSLKAGGAHRMEALANISGGVFSAPGSTGFGVFV